MGALEGLWLGLTVALSPVNLAYCFLGVVLGTAVGVLPGLGPAAAIALLLPATYAMAPTAAIIMLAGIYYGAMYGGSTTSILMNVPGEAASAVTCIDGYQMARQGRAGAGPARAGRGGPRDVGLRLIHRRPVRGSRPDAHRPPARPVRPPLRPPRVFRPDRRVIDAGELSRRDVHAEGPQHGGAGPPRGERGGGAPLPGPALP